MGSTVVAVEEEREAQKAVKDVRVSVSGSERVEEAGRVMRMRRWA